MYIEGALTSCMGVSVALKVYVDLKRTKLIQAFVSD
jgi:hypothetical protein